jgi:hypothetical protein
MKGRLSINRSVGLPAFLIERYLFHLSSVREGYLLNPLQREALQELFTWADTLEGHHYWYELYMRYRITNGHDVELFQDLCKNNIIPVPSMEQYI